MKLTASKVKGNGCTRGQAPQSNKASALAPVFLSSANLTCVRTPRTTFVDPGVEQPPQPLDPYGARSRAPGTHAQVSSPPTGSVAIAQAFRQLSVTENQRPHANTQRRETPGTSNQLFPVVRVA